MKLNLNLISVAARRDEHRTLNATIYFGLENDGIFLPIGISIIRQLPTAVLFGEKVAISGAPEFLLTNGCHLMKLFVAMPPDLSPTVFCFSLSERSTVIFINNVESSLL